MGVLQPPSQLGLPCFTYGVFRQGELAFGRLEPLLAEEPVRARVDGCLWIRDGLPLLELLDRGHVHGSLLAFDPAKAPEAYAKICEIEPAEHYRWEQVELVEPRARANVLVGRSPRKGAIESETGTWTAKDDPVFASGLEVVEAAAKLDGMHPFDSAPPDHFDWPRFFRLQAAYLLLWSAIERFSALRFGPGLDPGKRVSLLGEDPAFQTAAQQFVLRVARVVDSRDPACASSLQADEPAKAIHYYYRVRSNLSHRGKGAWKDGELVRQALRELLPIFRKVLASYGIEP